MKIFFITGGCIGDVVISTSIIAHLTDTYPEATFTIAAGAAAIPLFEAFPKLDRAIAIRKQPWKKHWFALWQQVHKERWGMVVDLRGSLLSFLLHAKTRIIFSGADKKKPKYEQHAGLFKRDHLPPPRLWSGAKARKAADLLLPKDKEVIVLAPKSNSAAKDWPIERFAQLMQRMYRDNFVFVILALKEQKESVQPLVNAVPADHVIDLSGETDLPTAYAILERTRLFIGNDSGLFHMAAAAWTNCIGIYGPTNDKMYAPQGPHVRIVKSYDFELGEKEKRDNKYMQMISVDMVEEVLLQSFLTSAKKPSAE